MSDTPWIPVGVVDVDLLTGASSWDGGSRGGRVLALLRAHTRSLGVAELDLGPDRSVADLRADLAEVHRDRLERHTGVFGCGGDQGPEDAARGGPPCLARRDAALADAPPVSVVIATHDRPALLARTLESVLDQEHPALEVVVVDNARSSDATEQLVTERFAARSVRYVREDEAGLGRAHNAGLAAARGAIIAITDDDVLVDRQWIAALLEAFADSGAGCVTGLILPVELRTREQSWVEQYGGFARGFDRREFSMTTSPKDDPLFPFTAGRFGSGANMAFTRALLHRMGGFDPALGAGTKAMGGDDLAAFAQTLLLGEILAYQPDAIVRHDHHDSYPALRRMAHGYGVGLGAYLTSLLLSDPRLTGEIVRRIPAGLRHLTRSDSTKNLHRQSDYPHELVVDERRGVAQGPVRYLASRRSSRQGGRT